MKGKSTYLECEKRWVFRMLMFVAGFYGGYAMLVRGGVFIPTMLLFLVAVAFYMVVELGTAPYDAGSQIIASHTKKVSFTVIRISYDIIITVIGFLLGGKVGIFTVASCFFLGPVISAIAAKFKRFFL